MSRRTRAATGGGSSAAPGTEQHQTAVIANAVRAPTPDKRHEVDDQTAQSESRRPSRSAARARGEPPSRRPGDRAPSAAPLFEF